jgi:glycerol-3-phosphate cytidylyltransferase
MGATLPTTALPQAAWPGAARPQGARFHTAITYGTFDLFHVGHLRLFQRIRAMADRLVVAVSTDEFNAQKGKRAIVPFADRLELVAGCRFVDLAIAEAGWDQKEHDIVNHEVDLFVMGDDWAGRFDHLAPLCEVRYLPRTDGVSSSLLRLDVIGHAA